MSTGSRADPRVFAPAELETEDGDDAGRGNGRVDQRCATRWDGVPETGEEVVWGEDEAYGSVLCLLHTCGLRLEGDGTDGHGKQ